MRTNPHAASERGQLPKLQQHRRLLLLQPLLRPSSRTALVSLLLFLLLGAFLFWGQPARTAARVWAFAAPFSLALLYMRADVSRRGRLAAGVISLVGFAAAWIDAAVRGFIFAAYGSEPLSGFVVESVANTHPKEAAEYFWTAASEMLPWALLAAAGICISAAAIFRLSKLAAPVEKNARPLPSRLSQIWTVFLVLFAALVWSLRPWRALLPPIYWTNWLHAIESFQAKWTQFADEKQDETSDSKREILSRGSADHTIVLTIGESTVRDHFSIYGYERRTTPKLEAQAADDERLVVVQNAWSADANTLGAFRSMFKLPGESKDDPDNVFAYFHAAGWKIWWISNQDDTAIKGEFAAFADHQLFLNPLSGRSSLSLDGKVIAPLEKALADPAEKKLIVVHLIGAHPHYSLRYPPEFAPKWPEGDAVERHLESLDRSAWIIDAVNQYDAAMTYQDDVLNKTLELTKTASRMGSVDWIYLSDHGQELGRWANRTGHSRLTPSGYRIPLLLWSSDGRLKRQALAEKPFRADRLSPLLLTLAGIDWKRESAEDDFLSSAYDWDALEHLPDDADLKKAEAFDADAQKHLPALQPPKP